MRWLALAFALAWSTPAFACTTLLCDRPLRTFGEGAVVPGNLVYFAVRQDGVFTLEHEDGRPIAASTRMLGSDRVFAPDAPIEPGRVRVRWRWRCEAQDRTGEYNFSVGPQVTLPAEKPELVRDEHGASEREGYVTVGYLNGYAHLFDVQFHVDDKLAQQDQRSTFTLRSPCDRAPRGMSTCGAYSEFDVGPHAVRARGHVVGTEITLDDSVNVTSSCEQATLAPPACGTEACGGPPVRLFSTLIEIPGNLAYFKLRRAGATLSLATQAGAPIASSVRTIGRDLVFAPDAAIPANTSVRLSWSYECGGTSYTGEYEFSTRASEPVQLRPGMLWRGSWNTLDRNGEKFGYAGVSLLRDEAAAHLYEMRFLIDGDKLASTEDIGNGPEAALYAPCDREPVGPDACGVWHELPQGANKVVAESHVIGADSDPAPVTGSIIVPCDVVPSLYPGQNPDGGTDAGSPKVDASGDAGTRAERRDGCRLATSDASGLWLALALLLRRKRQ